ncbi:Proteinaceous RNase P 3 [Apostasia shenzhenica]|uniref:ribonuclease P n=1 Tax=Apostasia shenzhenica TaxID=1088818 RepID=A0A2I0BD55_9ASPA|nr:Proteinaceous RNase P 3 [Apostasia shenzhenica]
MARKKGHKPEAQFRHALDTCSKNNDLSGALALYESADAQNIHLSSYHFNSLLHILSASLQNLEDGDSRKDSAIVIAFRLFDRMVAAGETPTEATITTMARIAASRKDGGGDQAFDLVKTMGERYGATPKLRCYGPALLAFCRSGEAEKAYSVEEHMVSKGILPEEPEIAALLALSAKEERADKVYGYLQNLRSSVGRITPSTADVLEKWFTSGSAVEAGTLNSELDRIKYAILMNGGGWHGLGWLGKGRWEVCRGTVSREGNCSCCGHRLACVDIDHSDTDRFSVSVASLAMERETRANFKNFQEWLDKHASYEAVIDGANISLYQQNFADGGFSLSQLNAVVVEIQQRSHGKWPLIILHNKRYRLLLETPSNRQLLETWNSAGALYATPNGSNDDWYWLYAAVRLKCLLVTNDEMRDHIFELLGRSFFPRWKERHQVKYTFAKGHLVLKMPPPYSLVIQVCIPYGFDFLALSDILPLVSRFPQESETGSWHMPLDDNSATDESSRIWLCITRPASSGFVGVGFSNVINAEVGQAVEASPAAKENRNPQPSVECHGFTSTSTGKRKKRDLHELNSSE